MIPLLYGCTAQEEPKDPEIITSDPEPVAEVGDVSTWTFDEGAGESPPLSLDEIEGAVEEALLAVLSYDARPVVDAYEQTLASQSSESCPMLTTDGYGNAYWQGYCEAESATVFGGYLSQYVYAETFDPYSGLYLSGSSLAGNIALSGPMGTLDLEGQATFITGYSEEGLVVVSSALYGGFYADGLSATGWMSDAGPASLAVDLFSYALPAYDGLVVGANGSVVAGDYAVVFLGTQMGNEIIGSLCEIEPGGSVQVRDPYGRWVDVAFQGPQVDISGGDPAQCDGCGDVTLDGEPMGSICPDFTPWYLWELAP